VPFYPFFWHISGTTRATRLHMSIKVDHNEDFKKSTLDWQDLAVFITTFLRCVITMDVHKAIVSTHRGGGRCQDDVTPQGVCG